MSNNITQSELKSIMNDIEIKTQNIEKKNISNFLILNIDTFIAINNCLLDNTTISA